MTKTPLDPTRATATADPDRRALRRRFRQRRRRLPTSVRAAHAEAAARHFFAAGLQLSGRTFGAYVAADGELDPSPLLRRLLHPRRRLGLPVVGRGGTMDFYRVRRDTRFVTNRFGIAEPAPGTPWIPPLSIDVLLMPLVAFDDRGNRLGMGAGFYDRFLGRLPHRLRPRLIGMAHEVQRSDEALPTAPWDVPLDGVLTEAGWQPVERNRQQRTGSND
jgi:5-formyltetrahydrofolate cyclo-ligase